MYDASEKTVAFAECGNCGAVVWPEEFDEMKRKIDEMHATMIQLQQAVEQFQQGGMMSMVKNMMGSGKK